MAKYKVLQKSFIDNAIREEGEIIEFAGPPAGNLEPADKAAKLAVLAPKEDDVARMHIAALGGNPDTGAPVDAPAQDAATPTPVPVVEDTEHLA